MRDLIGKKFGKLTVLGLDHIEKYTYPNGKTVNIEYLKCKCDCGNFYSVRKYKLLSGHTRSCGCLRKEVVKNKKPATIHGLHKTRIYQTWHHMKQRCYDKGLSSYKDYGGRGITIYSEWQDNFMAFYDWAMNNGYSDELSIDRIDNNKGYFPENCRWITMKEQQRNTRNNRLITYNNETHCLAEWAEILNIKKGTLLTRLNKLKWTVERAFTEKIRVKNSKMAVQNG